MTQDGRHISMSDGTPQLRIIDPADFREVRRITVSDDGEPVSRLNELEYVEGEILANVWLTSQIARIDPDTGRVKGWIDLSPLVATEGMEDGDAVLNGLAYDAKNDRRVVSGNNCPHLYEKQMERTRKSA